MAGIENGAGPPRAYTNLPMVLRSRFSLLVAAFLPAIVAACGSDDGSGTADKAPDSPPAVGSEKSPSGDDPAAVKKKLEEKPWEIVSNKGETYLPNVFYADASQNEQVMPYAIDGHVMIDRMIYPTLGNPNLYTKSDATDEFMIVLRLEDDAIAHLNPKLEPIEGSSLRHLVVPSDDPATGFGFFLIPRGARDPSTESTKATSSGQGTGGIVRIWPNEILVSAEPADMPEVLKKRKTVRFVFRQGAMAKVPAGLYDVRFEVKKDNEIYKTPSTGPVFEYQYNAVRVFDTEPDEYSVVNVTDTQVSVGSSFGAKTRDKLDEFVQFLNTTNDPAVKNAQFITFNGDLHNGGSPGSLLEKAVAWTYNDEAKAIISLLKYLPMPIFLTTGNHDGYVSTGHVPSAVSALDTAVGTKLREVMQAAEPKAWPGFSLDSFDDYITKTEAADQLGGIHRDIFTGGFARTAKIDGFGGWKEIPRADRNYIVYDGFNQWQKSYGPLYYSHKFGKSFYISLNSFELRQHRRSGWGMYTVNYGGGMSDVQMSWLDRELLRAKTDQSEVVVLAHHDPRGGHKGQDQGYFYEQLEYRSVYQSAINYLVGKVWNPAVCKFPDWALSREQTDSCVHDGLQEWMRPDPELDCAWDQRKADFTCDPAKGEPFMSGIELMKRISNNANVRTVLLGHTHYNELQVIQQGQELLPGQFPVTGGSAQKFATLEVVNPLRGYSVQQRNDLLGEKYTRADYDHKGLSIDPIENSFDKFVTQYGKAMLTWPKHTLEGTLSGGPRESTRSKVRSRAARASS